MSSRVTASNLSRYIECSSDLFDSYDPDTAPELVVIASIVQSSPDDSNALRLLSLCQKLGGCSTTPSDSASWAAHFRDLQQRAKKTTSESKEHQLKNYTLGLLQQDLHTLDGCALGEVSQRTVQLLSLIHI